MLKKGIIYLFYIVLLSISIFFKISLITYDPVEDLNRDIQNISNTLSRTGWQETEKFKLLNNSFLITTRFKNKICPSSNILLTPLYRNSENVPVIEKNFLNHHNTMYFIYNGITYDKFPSFPFWIGQNFQRFQKLYLKNSTPYHNYVLSIIETTHCSADYKTDWSNI